MHVLIASSDHLVRAGLQQVLQTGGHTSELATDLVETLGRFRQNPAEVVLIDCTPAGIDGVALCQRIRAQVNGKQPHVIVMLDAAEIAVSYASLAAGADDWLIKSDDAAAVLARLAVAQRMLQQKTDLWRLQGGSPPATAPAVTPFMQRLRHAATPRSMPVAPVPDLAYLARLADKFSTPIAYIDHALRLAFFNMTYASDPFGEFRTPPYIGANLQDVIGVPAFESLSAEIGCALSAIPVHFTREHHDSERKRTLDVSYFPDCDFRARVLGFFSVTLDVTAERSMVATVEWQNLLLQGLAGSMQMASMLLDATGKILFHNDALATLLGNRAANLRSMPVGKIMDQAFHAQHREPFAAALAGITQEVCIVLATAAGVARYNWTYAPQRNATGAIVGVWCNVTDGIAALPAATGMHGERRRHAS